MHVAYIFVLFIVIKTISIPDFYIAYYYNLLFDDLNYLARSFVKKYYKNKKITISKIKIVPNIGKRQNGNDRYLCPKQLQNLYSI